MSKVALVTGGSRGIGRGIALSLAARGWRVVINYRGNAEAANTTTQDIIVGGGEALAIQANIGLIDDHQRIVDTILEKYGRLDLLVNNAGMAPRERRDILETTEASYDEVMKVNLKGAFFLTQRVSRLMIDLMAQGNVEAPLHIINIGSISAYASSINRAEYCLSKAGMGMMTSLFADRLANEGILVYELRPGIIATDMTSGVTDKYDRLIDDGLTPIRRWGVPDDIGKAVVAITEGLFPFSTGEVINIDGGFHLHRL